MGAERLVHDQIRVSVPAEPGFVALLRSVVAGVAGLRGFGVDAIEDLRLAIGEACADLLEQAPASTVLGVDLEVAEGALEAVVWTDGRAAAWSGAEAEGRLSWLLLRALTDEATMIERPRGPGVRLVKRTAAPGAG
jgi:serine/threonine-protein kinase RsbW